jgi:hypothetical protein
MRLTFRLDHLPNGDDLPVRSETLHAEAVEGAFRVTNAPFFVSDLSCGDIIEITSQNQGEILEWRHVSRSDRSTIWLLSLSGLDLAATIEGLKELGCRVEGLPQVGIHSVDAPTSISAESIDSIISTLDEKDVAVAYPAWRHKDEVV